MKRLILFTFFAALTVCSNAQFKLTPSSGLMTEEGPYAILRSGTEEENYEAAKKAVEQVIPNAEFGDIELENSFSVTAKFKGHQRLPGALVATDWVIDYQLNVEVTDDKIMISFAKIGDLEIWKKGEVLQYIHPTTGKNSMLVDMTGNHYLFNSDGNVATGAKKIVAMYEDLANKLVKKIEATL